MRRLTLAASLMLTAALPAQFPLGHATPVNGHAASLFAQPIWIGNPAYGYRIAGAPPGGTALVAVSAGRQDQVVNGLDVYLDLANVVITHQGPIDATGRATLPFPLASPDEPALAGLQLYAQAAVTDPAAPGSLGATEALLIDITLHPMLAFTAWMGEVFLVDPVAGQVVPVGGLPLVTINEMEFGNGGRDLFIATSNGLYLVDTFAAVPQATLLAPGSFSGIRWDRVHRRVYALAYLSITVLEGDRASAAFGTIVTVAPDSGHQSLDLSSDGRVLVFVSLASDVTRRDADPSSPTYLQIIPTPPIPPPYGGGGMNVGRVHISPDGRVVSLQVHQFFPPGGISFHRFDALTGAWIDYDPVASGYQPLSSLTHPTLASGYRVFPHRDGSGLVFSAGTGVLRTEIDLASPANIVTAPTPVSPNYFEYIGLTPAADFLIRRNVTGSGLTAVLSLVDFLYAQDTPFAVIPGSNAPNAPVMAWR